MSFCDFFTWQKIDQARGPETFLKLCLAKPKISTTKYFVAC